MQQRQVLSVSIGVADQNGEGDDAGKAIELGPAVPGVGVEQLGSLAQQGAAGPFVLGQAPISTWVDGQGLAEILLVDATYLVPSTTRS